MTIRVADLEASEAFYEAVLRTLGVERTYTGEELVEWKDFSIAPADAGHPVTENLHVAFPAGADAAVDAFHQTAVGAGYRDNGPPGERPEYHPGYYGAFVLDPDGHNVELVSHNR